MIKIPRAHCVLMEDNTCARELYTASTRIAAAAAAAAAQTRPTTRHDYSCWRLRYETKKYGEKKKNREKKG